MGQLLITFGLFTYLFAIGLREGYTWASHQRRLTNGIISGGSKIDYHAWRHIESIGVWIAAGGAFLSELPLGWLLKYLSELHNVSIQYISKKCSKHEVNGVKFYEMNK